MATKYSFHIRPQAKRRSMKITGRSEVFGNEIDDETLVTNTNFGEQTIVIPTKGFSAQATRCLPHASEIEVETGPYFAGKIVVDGGNCGVKGNPLDPLDKYTMRIDHKMCKSMVKPQTNTVETFITVQENLGIFTHSTRRFVVVCSYQSGMQTVRASFTVPGKDGVAAAVENDPFEADEERSGRGLRPIRYVDKSALVLKESNDPADEESVALVQEVKEQHLSVNSDDTPLAVAILEDIVPGINEQDIKHAENEVFKQTTDDAKKVDKPVVQAKYAKLVGQRGVSQDADLDVTKQWLDVGKQPSQSMRNADAVLRYITSNMGSVVLIMALTVIMVGICLLVVFRELRRINRLKEKQTRHKSSDSKKSLH